MAVFSDTIVVWIQFCGTLWVGLTEKNVWGVVGSLCGLGLPFTEPDLGPLVILHILRRKLPPAAKFDFRFIFKESESDKPRLRFSLILTQQSMICFKFKVAFKDVFSRMEQAIKRSRDIKKASLPMTKTARSSKRQSLIVWQDASLGRRLGRDNTK